MQLTSWVSAIKCLLFFPMFTELLGNELGHYRHARPSFFLKRQTIQSQTKVITEGWKMHRNNWDLKMILQKVVEQSCAISNEKLCEHASIVNMRKTSTSSLVALEGKKNVDTYLSFLDGDFWLIGSYFLYWVLFHKDIKGNKISEFNEWWALCWSPTFLEKKVFPGESGRKNKIRFYQNMLEREER